MVDGGGGGDKVPTDREVTANRPNVIPYFSIDNAHLVYNTHPILFRHSF
jgi:hypothetical protein